MKAKFDFVEIDAVDVVAMVVPRLEWVNANVTAFLQRFLDALFRHALNTQILERVLRLSWLQFDCANALCKKTTVETEW